MDIGTEPHIVAVDRLEVGLVVAFSDGRCALYSISLLFSLLSDERVRVLDETEGEDGEPEPPAEDASHT